MAKKESNISLKDVPLSALQERSLLILYTLNIEMALLSDDGEYRDWRGVLKHAPVLKELKEFLISGNATNYMKSLIYQWINVKGNNIESLQIIFKKIDRYDIYDDTKDLFMIDAEAYRLKTTKPVFERTENGSFIITKLDRDRDSMGKALILYDAFLMFSKQDKDLADLIKETLSANYGMQICTKHDILGNIPLEHEVAMTLMGTRCRRVIVIVSEHFLNSPADTFMAKYSQHIGIEQSTRKIIPCLREECEIPSNMRILFHLKYYNTSKLFNFWKKIYEALDFTIDDEKENTDDDKEKLERIPYTKYYPIEVPKLEPKPDIPVIAPSNDEDTKLEKSELTMQGGKNAYMTMQNFLKKEEQKNRADNQIPFKAIRQFFNKKRMNKFKFKPNF
uniref:CSON010245 protein n=1 Tax=Culicoides sonorensis TaxID=179676 RepID=A0A336M1G6_CULSO